MKILFTNLVLILPFFLIGQTNELELDSLEFDLSIDMLNNLVDEKKIEYIDTLSSFLDQNSLALLKEHGVVTLLKTKVKHKNVPSKIKNILLNQTYTEISHNYLKTRIDEKRIEHTNLSSIKIGFPSNQSNMPFNISVDIKRLNGEFNLALSTVDLQLNPQQYLDNLIQRGRTQFKDNLPDINNFNLAAGIKRFEDRRAQLEENLTDQTRIMDVSNPTETLQEQFELKGQQILEKKLDGKWSDKFVALQNLSPDELKVWEKELEFSTIQKIINHPKFQPLIDSIRKDTIMNVSLAKYKEKLYGAPFKIEQYKSSLSQLDSIDQEKYLEHALRSQGIDTLLSKYQNAWKVRSSYYGDSLKQIKEGWKSKGLMLMDENISQDSLKQYLTDNKMISKFQKVVSNFEQLSLGQGNLNEHWLVAKYLNFNGLQFAYRQNKLLISTAVGRQRFNFSFLPFLGAGLSFNRNDKDLFFAKVNYELNTKNDIGFSFLGVKENHNENTSLAIFPERSNQVFSFNSTSKLTKSTEIIAQISYSLTRVIESSFQETFATNKLTNFAGEIRLRQGFKKLPISLDAGIFQVGENYLTLGNPFLRRGRAGFLMGINGQVLEWLNLNFEVRKEQSIQQTSLLNASINEFTAIGIVRITPTKNISINASAFPSQIKYNILGNDQDGYNLWNYALSVDHQVVKSDLILHNSLGFTNSLSEVSLAELESNQNIFSLNYSGQLLLNNKHILSVLGSRWFDFENNEKQAFSEIGIVKCNYEYVFGKVALKAGLQSNIYFNEKAQDIGIDCGVGYALNSRMNFSIDAYLPQLIKDANLPITWTQEYITTRFIYRPQQN